MPIMYMSAYIPPVLNNGVLNNTFNSADFESTYPDSFLPLSGGNIRGSLGVSGVIDADNDLMISDIMCNDDVIMGNNV